MSVCVVPVFANTGATHTHYARGAAHPLHAMQRLDARRWPLLADGETHSCVLNLSNRVEFTLIAVSGGEAYDCALTPWWTLAAHRTTVTGGCVLCVYLHGLPTLTPRRRLAPPTG